MVSDDMLSQDEIDALLRGTSDEAEEIESTIDVDDYFSFMERDALGEIGNISFGSSATALSTLLNQKVEINTPTVTVVHRSKLEDAFPDPYVAVQVHYTEGFIGSNMLVIEQNDAAIIADLMLGGDGLNPRDLLDEIQLSAVQEAMNQMMGSAATSMSTVFSKRVDISPPNINLLNVAEGEGTDSIPEDDILVKVSFALKIGSLIDSNIMQLLPVTFAKSLVDELLNPGGSQNQVAEPSSQQTPAMQPEQTHSISQNEQQAFGQQQPMMQHAQYQPQEQVYYQQSVQNNVPPGNGWSQQQPVHTGPQHIGNVMTGAQPTVQPAVFSSFDTFQPQQAETKNLDMLLDIPLQVTVELGRTKRSVKDILELGSGSIIELDKLAGEPVDILVNNRLIAQGEVVVIDENFGVRVTDIISQSDRLKKLK
ncbi:flagellar motor switch phosphatase FliY [Mesobacillus subterraneus]|uniref:flagellar motor switch phosphatase FliY n=1 Tax=Mesobacillus subterraneus TaxID=285983 RepID=UPI00203AA0CE|nr:flagellar motor switch phosphatase FliY [Mesobacillus subterraneus]MCM3665620.1 flagellar motor switch phosphatase FliY [Mesobacillus subterraneus]MCM3684366.1 flagellar motor switch phosphatase FliY [Mesobacillus subterraneus]